MARHERPAWQPAAAMPGAPLAGNRPDLGAVAGRREHADQRPNVAAAPTSRCAASDWAGVRSGTATGGGETHEDMHARLRQIVEPYRYPE